jgi:hypothetical protein
MPDNEKVFTQAELDDIVKTRLARQAKVHEGDIERFQTEAEKYKTDLTAAQAELKTRKDAEAAATLSQIETAKKNVDPAVLELLPTELDPSKQLAWLQKAAGELPAQEKTKTPVTPKPKGEFEKKFVPKPVQHSPI